LGSAAFAAKISTNMADDNVETEPSPAPVNAVADLNSVAEGEQTPARRRGEDVFLTPQASLTSIPIALQAEERYPQILNPSTLRRSHSPASSSPSSWSRNSSHYSRDRPVFPPAPLTSREFLMNIALYPFLTGVAQGLGTAFAMWLIGQVPRWVGWRRPVAGLISAGGKQQQTSEQ
jgi:hypothetical protein